MFWKLICPLDLADGVFNMRGLNCLQQPHGGSHASMVHPNAEAALPHAADVVGNK